MSTLLPVLISQKVLLPGIVTRIECPIGLDLKENNNLLVVPVKNPSSSANPQPSDLSEIGVIAKLLQIIKKTKKNSMILTLEGISRCQWEFLKDNDKMARSKILTESIMDKKDPELQALIMNLKSMGSQLAAILAELQLPANVVNQLNQMLVSTGPSRLSDLFASLLDLSHEEKLNVLSTINIKDRLRLVLDLVARQIQILQISKKVQTSVQNTLSQKQKEFLLRQQLEAIKKELGEDSDPGSLVDVLTQKMNDSKIPAEALKVAQRELDRLKKMNPNFAEYQVLRNYIELMVDLPWSVSTKDTLNVSSARQQLDKDHFGLEKVKRRIIEFLSIRKLKNTHKGPILCFVGPPGVGKTSLGKSIASAMGRKMFRLALGGVRDEAEIRGHRKTYVGAMPGNIIQGLRRVGVNNPVFLLDEIDKLGHDFRGDPAAAMLEVLDPEQNSTFTDHYLEVPFDLSNVLFIATANNIQTIPAALQDRMEIIRLSGYTFDEKLHIAKMHLIPNQLDIHGLKQVTFEDAALLKIMVGYTREPGVRSLNRCIGAICRYIAVQVAESIETGKNNEEPKIVTANSVTRILGLEPFSSEVLERVTLPGVSTGMAWTSDGSGALLFIEVSLMPGKGKLHLTGQLGKVMQESSQIALTWVRSNSALLGLPPKVLEDFEKSDIHIHFPAGATPKDGPSAGLAIVTALVSILTKRTVADHVAMTGEITLRGQVLPVGGIKEKVLAAHRNGIKTVVLPERNRNDAQEDIPSNVRQDMTIIHVSKISEALSIAFPTSKL